MVLATLRGGLAPYGTKLPACGRQQPVYGISKYGDLDPLLGKGWYLQVLNKGGKFVHMDGTCAQYPAFCQMQ